MSDTTVKLFAVPVRCFSIHNIAPVTGAWIDPYFETTIGLGFSGHCFESMTLIALISQAFSALVAPNGDEPRPNADGIVHLAKKIFERYFADHSGEGDPVVLLLMFGFDEGKPWIARITRLPAEGITSHLTWACADTLETVGQDALFKQRTTNWRERIQAHRASVTKKKSTNNTNRLFEKDLEIAHHDVAERKITEQEMIEQIEDCWAKGIGGVLQRLELGIYDGKVVAGFTQDDRSYVSDAYYSVNANSHLGPVPIVEKMGRAIRRPAPD